MRQAYGLRFKSARPYQPTFMYRALASGAADVIQAFSSDKRIAAEQLAVLADPKGAILPVAAMRQANYLVDRDTEKLSPDAAARWLEKRLGL